MKVKIPTIFLIFFLFLFGKESGAVASTLEVGETDLQSPSAAETYYGSGTTHTTKLIYDSGVSYTRPVELESLARALRNDPDLIYEFVRNRIETIPLYGLQKGALGAFIDRAGTPFDQAHLMVELLRESGYTANYKAGTITLDGAEFSAWLKLTDAKAACRMLADGGIPATVNGVTDCASQTGTVTSVTLAHVWVEVTIGGSNYVFDPAYKTHTYKTGIDLGTAMGYSAVDFYNAAVSGVSTGNDNGVGYIQNFNEANVESELGTLATTLLNDLRTNHFVADLEDITGGSDIDQEILPQGGLRQTSLPYSATATATWTGDIPDQYRTTLRVTLTKSGEADQIDVLFYVDEIYGRKLELSPDLDGADWASPQSGSFNVALKVDEKTVREDDGTTPAVFSSALAANARDGFTLELTVNHPYAAGTGSYLDRTLQTRIDLHTPATIVHSWGFASPAMLAKLDEEFGADAALPNGGSAQDNTKAKLGANLFAQFSRMAEVQANIANGVVQQHDVVGVIFTQAEIDESGGTYFIADQAIRIDLSGAFSANHETASAPDREALIHAIAASQNALEGSVMEQLLETPDTASTAARFAWGETNLTSAKYYLFEPGDEVGTTVDDLLLVEGNAGCLAGCASPFYLDHPTTVADDIKAYLAEGYNVLAVNDAFLGPGWELGYADSGSSRLATLQRGSAFIAYKDDLSAIGHVTTSWQGSYGGGGAPVSVSHAEDYHPEMPADIRRARLEATTPDGANILNGHTGYSTGEIFSIGAQGFPYALGVGFSYDEWKGDFQHSWHSTIEKSSSGLEALGESHHLRAVASIVAYYVSQDLYRQNPGAFYRIALLPFIQNWWAEQVRGNTVTLTSSVAGTQFVRLADGTYDPPVGANVTLIETGSRTVERKNEGTGDVTDPGNLYRNYNDSAVGFTVTLEDTTQLTFKNFTFFPGGASSANDVEDTQFRLEDMDFPYGINVHVTYGGGTSSDPYVTQVSNTLAYNLDFTNAENFGTNSSVSDNSGLSRQVTINGGVITLPEGEQIKVETGGLSTDPDRRPTVRTTLHRLYTPGRPDATIPLVEYAYDVANLVASSKDGEAIAQELASDPDPRGAYEYFTVAGHRGEIKNPLDGESTVYLDVDGNLAETIDPLGRAVSFSYDALGRLAEQVAPEGNESQFTYNDNHKITLITQVPKPGSGLSQRTQTFTYESTYLKPASVTDFKGETTSFTYGTTGGAAGQVTKITLPQVGADPVIEYEIQYNALGQITKVITPFGTSETGTVHIDYVYDTNNFLDWVKVDTQGTSPLEISTRYHFDAMGNLSKITNPLGGASFFTYDLNRRLVKGNRPLEDDTNFVFDPVGQFEEINRPFDAEMEVNEVTNFNFSHTGLRVRTILPDAAEILIAYDDLDRTDTVTDPEGRVRKLVYDAAGQVLQDIRGFGSVSEITYATYTYTDNGRVASVMDANGNKTEYFYDGFDRVSKVQYPDPDTAGASNPSDTVEFTYDANDNVLTRKTRKGDTITFAYDELNRVVSKTPGLGVATLYTYDRLSQLIEARYADGSYIVEYTFDKGGRVTQEKTTQGATVRTIDYVRDLGGNATEITYPNGDQFLYTFDAASRLTLVEQSSGADIAAITYNGLSRLASLKLGNSPASTYAYNIDGTVKSITHDIANTANDVTYYLEYDQSGMMTKQVTDNNSYVYTPTDKDVDYSVNGLNQYTGVTVDTVPSTLTYDANGNLISDGVWTYTFDAENRLISASDGATTVAYKYDPLGRRYQKDVDGMSSEFAWSFGQEIEEYDDAGNRIREFVYRQGIDNPVWIKDTTLSTSDKRRYPRADRQGTVIATTRRGGALDERYTYDAWGKPGESSNQPIRYTGRRYDNETGLYYYRARYYSPALGRFLQTDPIGYDGGMNLYGYVENNPANFTDPSGLSGCDEDCEVIKVIGTRLKVSGTGLAPIHGLSSSSRGGGGSFGGPIVNYAGLIINALNEKLDTDGDGEVSDEEIQDAFDEEAFCGNRDNLSVALGQTLNDLGVGSDFNFSGPRSEPVDSFAGALRGAFSSVQRVLRGGPTLGSQRGQQSSGGKPVISFINESIFGQSYSYTAATAGITGATYFAYAAVQGVNPGGSALEPFTLVSNYGVEIVFDVEFAHDGTYIVRVYDDNKGTGAYGCIQF